MKTLIKLFFLLPMLVFTSCRGNRDQAELYSEALKPIGISQIEVEGELGRRIENTIYNNLLQLKIKEDFLAPFLEKNRKAGYIGIGKLVDASVRFAHYSHAPGALDVKQDLIKELIKNQEKDGYIGMLQENARIGSLWDIHEMGYIIYGLVNDHRVFKHEGSLDAACKAADYIIYKWHKEIPANWDLATHMVMTGLDRALLALYGETENPKYLDFLVDELHVHDWDLDIVLGRKDEVNGHIYAYVTRCLALLELYSLQPDAQLLQPASRVINFLVKKEGMLISGGAGQWECWTNDQDGGSALGETCATCYQIRLYEKLLRMEGDPFYGDLMERTIYNALFAAQSPEGRKIRYYTPIAGERKYFERDTYCCPNNYRRIISELPAFVLYRCRNGIAINLFEQSKAEIDLSDDLTVSIEQITDYPKSGLVQIIVVPSMPASFPVFIRIPLWAAGAKVALNDTGEQKVEPGTFYHIDRKWAGSDTITMELPMEWRFIKGRRRQSGRIAVMRGPVVYCLNPDLNPGQGLEKMNPYELGRIMVDPGSIQGPYDDEHVRPNGTRCLIGAWQEGHGRGGAFDFELTLTEFIDPQGKACYFSLRDFTYGTDDELIIDGNR
jgi:DUF1680 family protein